MAIAPEGKFEERCVSIGVDTTNSGTDFISADFEIVDMDENKFKVEWRGWLTEKTMERTLKSLRLMGWDGDDIYEDLSSAKRNKVQIDVRHEEYKGKTTARVAFINELNPDPVALEKKRAAMREKLRLKARTLPLAPSQIDPDDDIGF